MERSNSPLRFVTWGSGWAKPKTKKPSESKYEGWKITDIGSENEEQKKVKKMRTRNTGIFLIGHASSTTLSFGDRIRSGTFFVVTSWTRMTS